jgi:hypothetical protein
LSPEGVWRNGRLERDRPGPTFACLVDSVVRPERHRRSTRVQQSVTRTVERPLKVTLARVRPLVQAATIRQEEHAVDLHTTALAGVDVMDVGGPGRLVSNWWVRVCRAGQHHRCEWGYGESNRKTLHSSIPSIPWPLRACGLTVRPWGWRDQTHIGDFWPVVRQGDGSTGDSAGHKPRSRRSFVRHHVVSLRGPQHFDDRGRAPAGRHRPLPWPHELRFPVGGGDRRMTGDQQRLS